MIKVGLHKSSHPVATNFQTNSNMRPAADKDEKHDTLRPILFNTATQ